MGWGKGEKLLKGTDGRLSSMAKGRSRRKEVGKEPQNWSQSQRQGPLCSMVGTVPGSEPQQWEGWIMLNLQIHAVRPPGRVNSRPCALGREILVEESNVQGGLASHSM